MYRPFAASTAPSPITSSFLDVESTIRGLTQDLCTAFNTGNYDQWALLFANDAQLMPPNHEPVQGLKAIERVMRKLGEAGQHDLRFETGQITLAGDMAFEVGRYTSALSQGNGTTVPQRGKYLRVWRRLGAWLIVAECWNSNLPLGKDHD
jgi:ketosteroid isomerase-like protein